MEEKKEEKERGRIKSSIYVAICPIVGVAVLDSLGFPPNLPGPFGL